MIMLNIFDYNFKSKKFLITPIIKEYEGKNYYYKDKLI